MKVLILSDTHGYNDVMWEVIKKESPVDMIIHCGDLETPYEYVRSRINATFHAVAGNNDYDSHLETMSTFNIGKYKAVLTHGHRYHLYSDLSSLYYLGVENQADFVFFGHVHVPVIKQEGPVTLINPGSLTYPRQKERIPTYMVMTVENTGKPQIELKYADSL